MSRSNVPVIVLIIIVVLACCLCLVVIGGGVILFGAWNVEISDSSLQAESVPPAATVLVQPPIQAATPPALPPHNSAQPDATYVDTLRTLENTIVPINDLVDLARRLEGKENIPLTLEPPPAPYQVGDQQSFWVTNVDTNQSFMVETTLQYAGSHLYFWIENGVTFSQDDLRLLSETFENEIFPTNREFFGSEWSPGVDGDPRLYIVFAGGLGRSIAGYYSSSDQYSPLAHEYSNAHEMFLLNADTLDLDESFTYGVLAHEYQHMIHWYQDRNEEPWLNEGFSELASFLNGYGTGGADYLFLQQPDRQLTTWPNNGDTLPHYGASFLFVNYFLNRFGEEITTGVVSHPDNGMQSIDQALAELGLTDPLTGELIQADQVFADWVVTNYLKDATIADGRYYYPNYPDAPQVSESEHVNRCPQTIESEVSQYGSDYYRISCSGQYTLRFDGPSQVRLLPADPYSGSYAFWSNQGDESDMTLTRAFDFSQHNGPLTLNYWTWYDIEKDYDYVYLLASTDAGERWQILTTPSGTAEDPSGNSYGWAYNGLSGSGPRWIEETVDLSDFAGQQVLLRFEYVTDAAVNGEGFLLDDLSIPEIGYFTDFESDAGGWEAAGFVRIQNLLPQTFALSVITSGRTDQVDTYFLEAGQPAEIPLAIGGEVDEVVLVVSGLTRYTRQPARYRFSLEAAP